MTSAGREDPAVAPPASLALPVDRLVQPDDVSCGPTSMAMVCRFHGDRLAIGEALGSIERNEDGGTLAVHIGRAALARRYHVRIWTWNLRLFDPSWHELPRAALLAKVRARRRVASRAKARYALGAYARFLAAGGEVAFAELDRGLLVSVLARGRPLLVGLSATYLYGTPREDPRTNQPDDVGGEPVGHFVVIGGYEDDGRRFVVVDPMADSPLGPHGERVVEATRLLNAVLLGQITYDAVLLEMWPAGETSSS